MHLLDHWGPALWVTGLPIKVGGCGLKHKQWVGKPVLPQEGE